MMRCPDIELQLASFAAGELDAAEAETVAGHVATCEACRAELACEVTLRQLLRELPLPICPDGVGDAPAIAVPTTPAAPAPQRTSPRPRRLPWGAGLVAAALTGLLLLADPLAFDPLSPDQIPADATYTAEQLVTARREMVYSLTLTARILDRTGRRTVSDVFSDRLPAAVAGSLRSLDSHTRGG